MVEIAMTECMPCNTYAYRTTYRSFERAAADNLAVSSAFGGPLQGDESKSKGGTRCVIVASRDKHDGLPQTDHAQRFRSTQNAYRSWPERRCGRALLKVRA